MMIDWVNNQKGHCLQTWWNFFPETVVQHNLLNNFNCSLHNRNESFASTVVGKKKDWPVHPGVQKVF